MTNSLGTMEDLPQDYRDDMQVAGVAPLWPMMRNVLPHGQPNAVTRPGYWNYGKLRPLLLRAGADREKRTVQGKTALQYAMDGGYRGCVDALLT